jgi:rSAM/selenodomain-associated transferase 2
MSRAEAARRRGAEISVIVPVVDEASTIDRLLDSLCVDPEIREVIVVDGGSSDATVSRVRARTTPATVIESDAGRALQMNRGARAATGRVLLFLHADTRLPWGAGAAVMAATRGGARGGNFAIRFDGGGAFSLLLGLVYRVQNALGVFYGDSAIWVRREVFDEMGGYRPLPIMEDYDFARRLRLGGGVRRLPSPVVTSSRRWKRLGILRTVATWVAIRYLFLLGVSAERLAGLYRNAR